MRTALVLALMALTSTVADGQELQADLDTFMAAEMTDIRVPGAVVAVVQDGKIVVAKGYGLADIASNRHVDAAATVFRLGSLTKPITAMAILQLVEAGKLDLHADVNRYLKDFRVPDAFGKPVTAHDLLTHTAGFDVRLNGTAARDDRSVRPLGEYLATDLPPRVRPPGAIYAYSNHGYTVLGALIEAISGEPYEQYVARHIFAPLGMTSASVRLTADIAARVATGYETAGSSQRLAQVIHPHIVPAAGLNATALDMAQFMTAMLEGGAIGGRQVIAPSALALMQRPQFRQEPRVPGMTYGWMESFWRGQRLLLHSGGINGYMAAMYLWPDRRLGLFVANNGYRGDFIVETAFHLMERWFPYASTLPAIPDGAPARAAKYAGSYRRANHSQRNLERAGLIRNAPLTVKDNRDGTLSVFGEKFVEIGPRLFRNRGSETLAFVEDGTGRPVQVVTTYPFQGNDVYERVPWWSTRMPLMVLLVLVVVLSLATIVRPPSTLARAIAALNLLFFVFTWLGARAGGTAGMLYGVPWQMDAASIAGAAIGATSLAMMGSAVVSVWNRQRQALVQVRLVAFAIVCVLFAATLWSLNLVGIHH
jgi:CubicO group peptidase (beta-lactamase class C family)